MAASRVRSVELADAVERVRIDRRARDLFDREKLTELAQADGRDEPPERADR